MANGFSFTIYPRARQVMTALVDPQVASAARKVLDAAKPLIGTRFSGHHPGKRLRDSGAVVKQGAGSYAVVFTHRIAMLHHEGSRSHSITARSARIPMFRASPSPTSNRYADPFGPAFKVNHPGTGGNPYLTKAARKVGLRLSGSLKRGTAGPFPIGRL